MSISLKVIRVHAIRDRPNGTGQKGPAQRDQDPKGPSPKGTMAKRDQAKKGPWPKWTMGFSMTI